MEKNSIELVKKLFKRYYYKYNETINKIEQREIGYATFDNTIIRHLRFKSSEELRAYILREVPADVYISNAYYLNPSAEMDQKGWLGADLIFDIDIKELELDCLSTHKINICPECKRKDTHNLCKNCNINMREVNIPCNNCIENGKLQVKRALDIINDLGSFDYKVYFSGNNGFHIHIEDKDLMLLDSNARREIADYVSGKGLIPEIFGISRTKNDIKIIKIAVKARKGWKGRIIKYLLSSKSDEGSLIRSLSKKRYDQFNKELQDIAKILSAYSIDSIVTIDTHRIFRLQGSLSSKSGLAKVRVNDIDSFNPFNEAVIKDDDPIKVNVYYSPTFILNDNKFGPYKDEIITLPAYAALYLICKGVADVKY